MTMGIRHVTMLLITALLGQIPSAAMRGSPGLELNDQSPQLGAVLVGKTSEQKILSLYNSSPYPVFLLQVQVTGEFQQQNLCPKWLAEASACLIYITFTPSSEGTRTGQL